MMTMTMTMTMIMIMVMVMMMAVMVMAVMMAARLEGDLYGYDSYWKDRCPSRCGRFYEMAWTNYRRNRRYYRRRRMTR
ncbi:hypothetical protein BDF22DRAFT_701440 [Syncephalis plumigaleata]|nr:hypothetical protein BDF22DRAFT_701440 [Syncephalis plumigaleata]